MIFDHVGEADVPGQAILEPLGGYETATGPWCPVVSESR